MQSTLGVDICFGHVPVVVCQGQRRDAAATREEQIGIFSARKSTYIQLYLYSGKLILAATFLRRVFVDGHSLAAGAPALTHVCTVGACGTKLRSGPPAAQPGADLWQHAFGDGAPCSSAAQRGNGAHRPPLFSAAAQRQTTKFCWPATSSSFWG